MIPHIAEVTAEHVCPVGHLWLPANTEQVLVWHILKIRVGLHNVLEVLNWPDLQNGLGKDLPYRHCFFQGIEELN